MTEPTEEGWQFFAAGLDEAYPRGQDPGPDYSGESRIDSVYARAVVSPATPQRATVVFDEVLVGNGPPIEGESALGDTIVVEDFENIAPYSVLASGARGGETTSLTQVEGGEAEGGFAAELSFLYGAGRGQIFGLRPASDLDVVPVLANDAFFENADVEEGEQFPVFLNSQYITLQVVGTFDYFPTWDPREDSFLFVANLDLLADVGSRLPFSAGGLFPNEAWIGDPPAAGLTVDELRANGLPTGDLVSQAALRAEAGSDPLVAASWEGILFLAFAAVLVLTALGFIVYSYLTAQTRRLEFAILRTMGFSGKQILGLVSFEQVFVIGAGVLVGTLLGMPLGRLMIGYMGVTETGEDILPPLVSQVSWVAVLTVYSMLAVVFVATIAALAALYSRLAVHRALRMGEL
ncbi:MAG: ABC transporter permease [Dehalococcoidia bacterium]|nr:ABC transporter permease [Dehalococcoidia bacterium]